MQCILTLPSVEFSLKSWCFIWDPSLLLLISMAKPLLFDLVPIIIITDSPKILLQLFQPRFLSNKMTVVFITLTGSWGWIVCVYKTPRKSFKYEQKPKTPLTEAAENLFSRFPSNSGHTLPAWQQNSIFMDYLSLRSFPPATAQIPSPSSTQCPLQSWLK